jgi:membrane associated rhomboid family serine protease
MHIMTLRTLAREIRDFPATVVFSVIWIAVFAAMVAVRMQDHPSPTWWRFLVSGFGDGHRFGDLTLNDLARGEWWRLITCTFVHYSLIHIALNVVAFYLLGTLLESWYGSPLSVLIYGITGAGGNLISACIKYELGTNTLIHAGGGSVVVMGQVGLCAVIGWRSRRSMGGELGWQMVKALALTGLLGIAFPRYIDNWGHAGGALAGFPLGLLHGWFIRHRQAPWAWGLGVFTGLVIAGCFVAQLSADRRESQTLNKMRGLMERNVYDVANRGLAVVALLSESAVQAGVVTRSLENVADLLDPMQQRALELASQARVRRLSPTEQSELDRYRQRASHLASQSQVRPLSPAEQAELDHRRAMQLLSQVYHRPLSQEEQDERDRLLGKLSCRLLAAMGWVLDIGPTRQAYQQIKRLAESGQTRALTDQERAELRQQLGPLRQFVHREQAIRVRELWHQRQAVRAPGRSRP